MKLNKYIVSGIVLFQTAFFLTAQETNNLTLEQLFRMAISEKQTEAGFAMETIKRIGPATIPFLMQKLEHPLEPGAVNIQGLVTYWKTNSTPWLIQSYGMTTNQRVRRAIVFYMGLIRDPLAGATARKELADDRNRSTALWTLGRCGITQSLEYAYLYLHSTQQMDRVRSIGIIRRVGGTHDLETLAAALNDPAWNVRSAAAQALYERESAGCSVLTGQWTRLSTSAKIHALSIISEVTNFYSAEVLKLYTSDTNSCVAAQAERLLKNKN